MADEIDAGLEELTSDYLGPAPEQSASPEPETPTTDEPTAEPEPEQVASEQTPTPAPVEAPPAPTEAPTFEIDGQRYTLEEIRAMRTTAQQLPHIQRKLIEERERFEAERQAAQAPPAQKPPDPAAVRAAIRANFDGAVKQAVTEGFIEEDFATLYPDVSANLVMYRDVITMVTNAVTGIRKEIDQYKAEIQQEQAGQSVVHELENNLVALSTTHPALASLAEPTERQAYFSYLQKLDPKLFQLRDPQFLTDQWAAWKRSTLLPPAQQAQATKVAAAKVKADQKRQARGDFGSSRPGAPAPVDRQTAVLEEMVNDFLTSRN